jgi:PKD repeat protein
VARIAFAPAHPQPGEVVTFDGLGSTDADGSIASYTWTFGNGNGAGGSPTVGASYPEAGTYHVRLVVVDDGGEQSEATADVVVETSSPSVPGTTPVTPPVAPPASAPLAYALASTGRAGTRVKLWYRLARVDSAARVEATVRSGKRVLVTLRADVAGTPPRTRYLVWRAPKAAQRLKFCVRVSIAAGGTSPVSCAPLQLR